MSHNIFNMPISYCSCFKFFTNCFISILFTRHKHGFDRSFTIRYSASNKEQYASAYDSISNALRLDVDHVSLRSLALQNGCDLLVGPSNFVLDAFMEKYLAKLSADQRQFISKTDPALVVAVFLATASSFKVGRNNFLP